MYVYQVFEDRATPYDDYQFSHGYWERKYRAMSFTGDRDEGDRDEGNWVVDKAAGTYKRGRWTIVRHEVNT